MQGIRHGVEPCRACNRSAPCYSWRELELRRRALSVGVSQQGHPRRPAQRRWLPPCLRPVVSWLLIPALLLSSLRYGLRPTQRPGMMGSTPKSCVADDDIKACLGGLNVIRVASKSVVFQHGLRSPSSAKRVSRRPPGCPQDLLLLVELCCSTWQG